MGDLTPARKRWGGAEQPAPVCNNYILAHIEAHVPFFVQNVKYLCRRQLLCNAGNLRKTRFAPKV
jgi:hypothetical protein